MVATSLCRRSSLATSMSLNFTESPLPMYHQWRRKMFHCRGAKIVGVSINFNAGESGGILPQEISKF